MNATAPLCALLQRSLSGDQWFGWMCEFVLTRLNAIVRRDDDEKDVDSARTSGGLPACPPAQPERFLQPPPAVFHRFQETPP